MVECLLCNTVFPRDSNEWCEDLSGTLGFSSSMISIKLSISIFETREIIPTWQDWVTINDKVYGAKPGPKQGTHKRWLLLCFMYCFVIFYSKTVLFFGPTINRKYNINNHSFRLCSLSPLLQFSNDTLKYVFKLFKGKCVFLLFQQ